MDIAEVARRSGVPASALRYYEERGLIASVGRQGARRVFEAAVLERLALIALGRSAGLSLDEIARMFTEGGAPRVDRALLSEKAEELDRRIRRLVSMRDGLRHAAACPARDHLQCPKFRRLLGIAAAKRAPRRALALALVLVALAACAPSDAPPAATRTVPPAPVPREELSLAAEPAILLDSADALIRRDSSMALVTVDADGRPRVRTVRAFRLDSAATPRDRFTVFVLTRMSTRKIEQLAGNPHATLYFNEDQRVSYATLMGRAIVHRDPAHPRVRSFLDSGTVRFFWPDYPRDFVILEIVPEWLEYIGPGIWNDPDTWRPQAVVFQPGA